MKKAFQQFCSFIIVRMVVKALLYVMGVAEKIYSHLKYRALVKNCSNSMCHWTTYIKHGDNLTVGRNSRIARHCTIGARAKITIGNDVVFGQGVTIETGGPNLKAGPPYTPHIASEIVIEDGVVIGTNAIVLGGVTIGKRSMIGAGTIVTKDVPPNSIVAGNPGRILKTI